MYKRYFKVCVCKIAICQSTVIIKKVFISVLIGFYVSILLLLGFTLNYFNAKIIFILATICRKDTF